LEQGGSDTDVKRAARAAGQDINARLPVALHIPSWRYPGRQASMHCRQIGRKPPLP
jgi:hypothetical protein